MKKRLDVLTSEKGIFGSREKAKAGIMAGLVLVDGQVCDKPGMSVCETAEISLKEVSCPYVSRGGLKLEKALKTWGFSLEGTKAVDIGASTGGFTDCMLRNGAGRVYCIDVGYGQLDWKLRTDERVVNMEKCNIRYLDVDEIGRDVDFASIDVSFISLKLVLPVAALLLHDEACLVCLVKPQFEAGREQVGKNGIVRDPKVHIRVIENVIGYGEESGLYPWGLTYSPITGTKGNIEYLLFMKKKKCDNEIDVEELVSEAHTTLK
ncbi:MAG: TlyA family RNA methyltransferase [Bacillota bacterium]|nr:TlyA family RNA methyltransferase [Bacillota bacterium]